SGLGLYVCKNIISSFGGTIELESNGPRGTLARVTVPLWRRSELPPRAAPITPGENAERPRVLVVDDEPFVLRSLDDVLRDQHDVVTCKSGDEARALLTNDDRFDVILCDVAMPHGTGPELLAWLRTSLPALADRLVFMTGGGIGTLQTLPTD